MTGDIMLDRGVKLKIKTEGKGDYKFPFLKIADYLKDADLLVGNLEGPISDKGTNVGSIYSFRMIPTTTQGLTYAGFDILSLANNHSFDYGRLALEDTLKRLKEAGINYIGAGFNDKEAFSPVIKEVKGIKIAFLSYTDLGTKFWRADASSSGIAWISQNDFEKVKKEIEEAKKNVDYLIVILHSGNEYETTTANKFQRDFAKMAIDSGADLFIGHHPHVVQPSEQYNNKWIFYSLGNFVFDQSFSTSTMEGEIVKVVFEKTDDSTSSIKEVLPIKIKINDSFQPEIATSTISPSSSSLTPALLD